MHILIVIAKQDNVKLILTFVEYVVSLQSRVCPRCFSSVAYEDPHLIGVVFDEFFQPVDNEHVTIGIVVADVAWTKNYYLVAKSTANILDM